METLTFIFSFRQIGKVARHESLYINSIQITIIINAGLPPQSWRRATMGRLHIGTQQNKREPSNLPPLVGRQPAIYVSDVISNELFFSQSMTFLKPSCNTIERRI